MLPVAEVDLVTGSYQLSVRYHQNEFGEHTVVTHACDPIPFACSGNLALGTLATNSVRDAVINALLDRHD